MRAFLGLITLLYPLVLYAGFRMGYHVTAVAVVLACFVARGYAFAKKYSSRQLQSVLVAGAALLAAGFGYAVLGTKVPLFWPVVVSVTLCGVFAASCWTSRCVIERIATTMEGPVPPEAKGYCRWVNALWIAFFAINAVVAFDSVFRSLEWWTLYNGVISYCVIAMLLVGEYVVRGKVKKRIAKLSQNTCLIALCLVTQWCYVRTIAHGEQQDSHSSLQLEQLRERLAPPGPFRVDFTEKRFVAVLSEPLESRGSMRCIPDVGLMWEVLAPIARTSIITPRGVGQVVGQGASHTTSDATNISQTMLSLLSGTLDTVGRHFDLAIVGNTTAWELRLTPRDSLVREVVSSVLVGGGARPERLEVRHASGDRVLTTFAEPRALTAAELEDLREALKRAA